ncbi:MAG: hypothetical protein JWQ82_535 [Tardiphaga sp.]|nr:hypothetical protein [Tardiphaga sp.]
MPPLLLGLAVGRYASSPVDVMPHAGAGGHPLVRDVAIEYQPRGRPSPASRLMAARSVANAAFMLIAAVAGAGEPPPDQRAEVPPVPQQARCYCRPRTEAGSDCGRDYSPRG